MTAGQPPPEDELGADQVEAQEAVEVPAREDMSVIAAEPSGSIHGDEETADSLADPGPAARRPDS